MPLPIEEAEDTAPDNVVLRFDVLVEDGGFVPVLTLSSQPGAACAMLNNSGVILGTLAEALEEFHDAYHIEKNFKHELEAL